MVATQNGKTPMVRNLICLFLLFIPTVVFADNDALKAIYGPRLYSANIDVKYAFMRAVGRKWEDSTYTQRRDFLINYQDKITQEAKDQDILLREKSKEEKLLDQKEQKALKAKEDAKRALERKHLKELQEEKKLKKAAEKKNKAKQRELDKMKQKDRVVKD